MDDSYSKEPKEVALYADENKYMMWLRHSLNVCLVANGK